MSTLARCLFAREGAAWICFAREAERAAWVARGKPQQREAVPAAAVSNAVRRVANLLPRGERFTVDEPVSRSHRRKHVYAVSGTTVVRFTRNAARDAWVAAARPGERREALPAVKVSSRMRLGKWDEGSGWTMIDGPEEG